jgi:hypothetical protein
MLCLKQMELFAVNGSYICDLVKKLESYQQGYTPTVWCFPSIPSVIVALSQPHMKVDYERFGLEWHFCLYVWSSSVWLKREILTADDGGWIAIDWENRQNAKNKLIVLILTGMTGSSRHNYVTHISAIAKQMDCIAVVMNYRGVEVDLKTPRLYHGSDFTDLEFLVGKIKSRYPGHKIFAVGVSCGNWMDCICFSV